jgi:DNA-binding response OmpR family regulator
LADGLRYNLEREGYAVQVAADGPTGLDAARHWNPDLILLDLMLPGNKWIPGARSPPLQWS